MPDDTENTPSAAKPSPLTATEHAVQHPANQSDLETQLRRSPSGYVRAWHDAIDRVKKEYPERAADFEGFRAYLPKPSP